MRFEIAPYRSVKEKDEVVRIALVNDPDNEQVDVVVLDSDGDISSYLVSIDKEGVGLQPCDDDRFETEDGLLAVREAE